MRSERVSVLCLSASCLIGLAVLAAWRFDLLILASFLPGTRAMAPLTAVSFVLLSFSAYCIDRRHRERHPRLRFALPVSLLLLCLCAAAAISDALSHQTSAFQAAFIPREMRRALSSVSNGRTSLISALAICLETLALASFSASELSRDRPRAPSSRRKDAFPRGEDIAAFSCSSALLVALTGLAILMSFLYSEPIASGAVAFPSGFAFAFLGVGSSMAIEGDPEGEGAWPLKAFYGPTMATRLLRAFVPLCAAITIGEGSLFALAGSILKDFSLATVIAFALLSLMAIVVASNVSRGVGASIDVLIEKRLEAERRLEASLRSREALLSELNHRTRNSLQLVLGLLDIEGAAAGDSSRLRERVAILAFIHDELSQGDDISAIESARFLDGLVSLFVQKGKVAYEKRAEPFLILFDVAAPLGLVIDDIDDAIRSAAPTGKAGLSLFREGGCYRFEYRVSLGRPLDAARLFVARAIVEGQLGGSILCEPGEKTRVTVRLGQCGYARRV